MDLADITYRIDSGVAHITINRPERMNAFRAQTCEELSYAFTDAAWNKLHIECCCRSAEKIVRFR